MELDFDVRINVGVLFDYLMRHTYTSLQGIVGVVIGILALAYYFWSFDLMYLLIGLVVLLYLPITLLMKAVAQARTNPAFKDVIHYHLDAEGITVSQGELKQTMFWDRMVKVVATSKSIILYTSPVNASIFPKKDLGDKEGQLLLVLKEYLPPEKLKIKVKEQA